MQATPWATSPKILRISDSVSRSFRRVFMKSIRPPPSVKSALVINYQNRIPSVKTLRILLWPIHKHGSRCTIQHVDVLLVVSKF